MARRKIGVIGGGFVGSTTAQRLAEKELGDVVLVDIVDGMPQGKALDLVQAGPVCGYDSVVEGANDYSSLEGAELVIITAGMPRKPGMDRSELLDINLNIIKQVGANLKEHCPDAFVIVITNPLDAIVYAMQQVTSFPPHNAARAVWPKLSIGTACPVIPRKMLHSRNKRPRIQFCRNR